MIGYRLRWLDIDCFCNRTVMQPYCVCCVSQLTQCLSALPKIVCYWLQYSLQSFRQNSSVKAAVTYERSVSYCASIYSVICLQVYLRVVTTWDYIRVEPSFFPLCLLIPVPFHKFMNQIVFYKIIYPFEVLSTILWMDKNSLS